MTGDLPPRRTCARTCARRGLCGHLDLCTGEYNASPVRDGPAFTIQGRPPEPQHDLSVRRQGSRLVALFLPLRCRGRSLPYPSPALRRAHARHQGGPWVWALRLRRQVVVVVVVVEVAISLRLDGARHHARGQSQRVSQVPIPSFLQSCQASVAGAARPKRCFSVPRACWCVAAGGPRGVRRAARPPGPRRGLHHAREAARR